MRKTFSCVIVALVAATFFAFPLPSSAQETPASSPTDSAAETNEATETSPPQTQWIAKVDEFFGKYLVAPVATFAFYPVPYYDFSAGECV